jgi:hypothetical protein
MLEYLVDKSPNLNKNALVKRACCEEWVDAVMFLVRRGANVNTICQGRSILSHAVSMLTKKKYRGERSRLLEYVAMLISNGAEHITPARVIKKVILPEAPTIHVDLDEDDF